MFLVALGLIGGFLIMVGFHPSGFVKKVLVVVVMCFFVAGVIGLRWAGYEASFLNKPEPKQPPRLWRFR